MIPEKITSLQNPRLKQLVNLRDRRDRDDAGLFLVEGYREVTRALEKDIRLRELYYSPEWFLGENEPALIDRAKQAGAQLFELSKEAFAKCSYRDRPDGLLALAPQWKHGLADLKLSSHPFLLVVESIEKPGNLGTILRSPDPARAPGATPSAPCTPIFHPNVLRSSTAMLSPMPIFVPDS